jgi:3,4-dihydroxy 2-butanone 4-phosphate synthase/GTP cyclohydrolase II
MARMPDLIAFAQRHGLKVGTIADLIAYRRRTERFVERVLEQPFESVYGGEFRLVLYRNIIDQAEHVALVKGKIDPKTPTLVRMHQVDVVTDILGHAEARQSYVPEAMRAIAAHPGAGVIVFLRDPRPTAVSERLSGVDTHAEAARGLRVYGVGAQILLDLGVRDLVALSSTQPRPAALEGYGLRITGWKAFDELEGGA